ncbi:hypothetical protein [Paenibacillus sp. 1P07SE]|uniref:hypothetical protein n=1 Tax=Paenibacillus sp. 1P07SE TaxID=3132209 RepID=UPI0039A4CF70
MLVWSLDGHLLAEHSQNFYVIDPADGKALYRMGDVLAAGIFESAAPWMRHAIIHVTDQDTLYIGSGNGYFSKVERLTTETGAKAGE